MSSASAAGGVVRGALARLAKEPGVTVGPLGDAGWAEVVRGGVRVRVNVLAAEDVLLVLAALAPVPVGAGEAWFRRLLERSFLQTGDAAFAIDRESDWVYLRAMRRLTGVREGDVVDLVLATLAAAERVMPI